MYYGNFKWPYVYYEINGCLVFMQRGRGSCIVFLKSWYQHRPKQTQSASFFFLIHVQELEGALRGALLIIIMLLP